MIHDQTKMERNFEEVESRPPAYASPSPKRKLNRQTPVSKRRDSPARVQRSHTFSTAAEDDDGEFEDCVYAKRNSRDSRHQSKYVLKRRKTMTSDDSFTQCHCRSHTGGLQRCRCEFSRQTLNPSISESELMKHETKLIVLEFLQNLRPAKLTARSKRTPSSLDFDKLEATSYNARSHSPDARSHSPDVRAEMYQPSEEEYADEISPDVILRPVEKTISPKSCKKVDKPAILNQIERECLEEACAQSAPRPSDNTIQEIATSLRYVSDSLETTSRPNAEEEIEKNEKEQSDEMILPQERLKEGGEKLEKQGSVKYNTVTIGEHEHQELLAMLKQHQTSSNEMTGGTRIGRSHSSISDEQYAVGLNKLRDMQKPVKQWLGVHSTVQHKVLVKEVPSFDGDTFRKNKEKANRRKKRAALSLKIPKGSVPPANEKLQVDTDLFTPETIVVNNLEEIAQEIMLNYPDQLGNITKEMLKIVTKKDVTYDLFSKVATSIYNLGGKDGKVTVFSRVAMVMSAVRETFFLGNLNDKQMELLVDYSTQFFSENAAKTVREEGGWQGALGEQIFSANGMTYDDDECLTHGPDCHSLQDTTMETDSEDNSVMTDNDNNNDNCNASEWTPYGVAALSVGLGLLYSYSKT